MGNNNNWAAVGDGKGAGNGGVATDGGMATGAIASAAAKESMEAAAKQAVPLKVMVFIDGTWLYYSFFGRFVASCGRRRGVWGGDWSTFLEQNTTRLNWLDLDNKSGRFVAST